MVRQRVREGEWGTVQCEKPSRQMKEMVNRGLEGRNYS